MCYTVNPSTLTGAHFSAVNFCQPITPTSTRNYPRAIDTSQHSKNLSQERIIHRRVKYILINQKSKDAVRAKIFTVYKPAKALS